MHPAADPVKSSRLLAMQYQGSFDESADGNLLPVIEEGIADGSIALWVHEAAVCSGTCGG